MRTYLFDAAGDVVEQHFARGERRNGMFEVLLELVVGKLQALFRAVGPQMAVHCHMVGNQQFQVMPPNAARNNNDDDRKAAIYPTASSIIQANILEL